MSKKPSKTFKVQFVRDGVLEKYPAASRSFVTLLLTWFKNGIIDNLQMEHK